MEKQIIKIIIYTILLLSGISIGLFLENIPAIEFEREISILGILTFLLTLAIGVIYPFLIKKWIDDNQVIKGYLIQEIEKLIIEISQIKEIIGKSFSDGQFNSEDKSKINFIFHSTEVQIGSIQGQFEVSFAGYLNIVDNMKNFFNIYKDFLTGGDLMNVKFSIDASFYKEHLNEYNKFEFYLKKMIHRICRI